jgi:hypothetical protein
MAMQDVGIPIVAGSGVAAAETFYRENGEHLLMAAQ